MIAWTGVTKYGSGSQADGMMTRTGGGVIAGICGSESQVGGMTRRMGAGLAACASVWRRDAAEIATSSPEASGTRIELSWLSSADAFAVTSSAASFKMEM
jgi:hypothetical protein